MRPACVFAHPLAQPHVEAATIYGLRRQSLLVFVPKYHLRASAVLPACRLACPPALCRCCAAACAAMHPRTAPPSTASCLPLRPATLQGVIHLTDKAGLSKPPLRQPGDEQLDEPSVLSYRRGLAVVAGGPDVPPAPGCCCCMLHCLPCGVE